MMIPRNDADRRLLEELQKKMIEQQKIKKLNDQIMKDYTQDIEWADPGRATVTRGELALVKTEIAAITKKFNNLETELLRKNAYIEKLCSSLMLIIHNPEKLKELDGLKEQYDKYIMLGRLVYGNDFDEILKGLR